ncbi:MAG: sugar ABC transporter substrate-binding protein [Burkholderiaceae bacterium]
MTDSTSKPVFDRRRFLQSSGALGATGLALGGFPGIVRAADPIHFFAWSAAVDTVKSHINAFEKATGLKVSYNNAPWAQYRDTMVTKFVGGAPLDMMWVSDSWLPEFADAGWLAPIDDYPQLTAYNADVDQFCTDSASYQGKQYGLTYYTDHMAFFYDKEKLEKAGIAAPPTTWEEVLEQSLKIKQAGLSEYPLMLSMARESWLIEFISAMVFSNGGRLVDDDGNAVMHDPAKGAGKALQWVVDAVNKHKIVSPACVETGELNGLKAFTSGNHAFALLARYRVRTLNDPKQSQIAGRAVQALMPAGPGGSHATVGWMRFHGLSAQAAANKERAANAVKLIEWFGGKAQDEYRFQKLLFQDVGAGFCTRPLFDDAEVKAGYNAFSNVDVYREQQGMARKKDVVARWFGEWNEVNGTAWQSAILGKSSVQQALKTSAASWDELKKQS